MRRLWAVAVVLVAAVMLLASCGGDDGEQAGGGGGQGAACEPSGTSLEISADDIAFDTDCLAAPAGQAFTIQFDNRASVQHNVAIYETSAAEQALFTGEIIEGGEQATYRVPAQEAGTYFFRCDVHPQRMTGTFVVK